MPPDPSVLLAAVLAKLESEVRLTGEDVAQAERLVVECRYEPTHDVIRLHVKVPDHAG